MRLPLAYCRTSLLARLMATWQCFIGVVLPFAPIAMNSLVSVTARDAAWGFPGTDIPWIRT
jgi:hypothetical protein